MQKHTLATLIIAGGILFGVGSSGAAARHHIGRRLDPAADVARGLVDVGDDALRESAGSTAIVPRPVMCT
jgi:hypothetical protein